MTRYYLNRIGPLTPLVVPSSNGDSRRNHRFRRSTDGSITTLTTDQGKDITPWSSFYNSFVGGALH